MLYSCRHCQRINFVEPSTSHHGHPGLNGPQKGINASKCLFGVHSTLDGHGGLWKVLQSRYFGSGDKNIALISGAVGMMGHNNYSIQFNLKNQEDATTL